MAEILENMSKGWFGLSNLELKGAWELTRKRMNQIFLGKDTICATSASGSIEFLWISCMNLILLQFRERDLVLYEIIWSSIDRQTYGQTL
jgi:hypothetical protein